MVNGEHDVNFTEISSTVFENVMRLILYFDDVNAGVMPFPQKKSSKADLTVDLQTLMRRSGGRNLAFADWSG